MDFYLDIGFAVLFRVLRERHALVRLRPAFLKLFKAIWYAYGDEEAFREVVRSQ
jgi:hypothetical protein